MLVELARCNVLQFPKLIFFSEQVLQELKQSWETKLMASKAVETQEEIEKKLSLENGAAAVAATFPKQQQVQQPQPQQVYPKHVSNTTYLALSV